MELDIEFDIEELMQDAESLGIGLEYARNAMADLETAAAPRRPQLPQLSWSELHELIGDATSRLKLRWELPMRRVTLLREARRAARRSLQYAEPRRFFKQFRRYASLKNLSGVVALDLICYALGSCRRAAWVADRVEAEVQAAERDATVSAAEQKVLHLLTPEVMKGQILQGLDQRRLQPGETPREYVEALKSQIQQVMPELTAESLDRMTIVQAIKGAPEAWSHKLGEGDLSSLDQLVTHMTLLHGKQRSAARRCQETGRSEVREPAATVCRCVVTDCVVEDFEDSLDEEVMPFLDQVKTQANLSHLSTVDQERLKAVLDQSDVFSSPGQLGRVTPGPGARLVTPGPGARQVTPGPGARQVTPDPGARLVTPGSGARQVTPGPGARQVTPGPGARLVTPDPGARLVTPGPGARQVTPGPGARHVKQGPGARLVTPGPGARLGDAGPGRSSGDAGPGSSAEER
ncbi:Coagulation factor V [Amphibalanus amphitrite]|uniref:Coagulation factor V n=1 Tax=Amphibalanus amphitrite TaxID=1232801 RepID=A0A6A4V6A4_AMPAM|nr:Coagulation factor V [Amphibalanus amphitrite]